MGTKGKIFKVAAEALAARCKKVKQEHSRIEEELRERLQELQSMLTDEQSKVAELVRAVHDHKALMDLIRRGIEIGHLPLPSNINTGFSAVTEVKHYSRSWTTSEMGSTSLGIVNVFVSSAGENNGRSLVSYHLALIPFDFEAKLYPPLRFVEVPQPAPDADASV